MRRKIPTAQTPVAIIIGSESDLEIAKECKEVLDDFGVPFEIHICSAHRSPQFLTELITELDKSCLVYIAIAGMAAHLPGAVSSKSIKPVIGVPANGNLQGLDALLSIAQMPPGVPVATVAINGGKNAALLAIEVLALTQIGRKLELVEKLKSYRLKLERQVREDDKKLRT